MNKTPTTGNGVRSCFFYMKRAYIFANGRMDASPPIIKEIKPSDLVIAADGGSHHCRALGIIPSVIIGDLDSLTAEEVRHFEQNGVRIIRYPTSKDETDLELALLFAQEHGIDEVIILGALGARWDMTFANVLLAAHSKFTGLSIRLVDGTQELSLLRGSGGIEINERKGQALSLIPIGGDANGITTTGLEYPLHDETLYLGSPRGVSNVIIGESAGVTLKSGILLVCLSSQVDG
jgi:thiamine pyrophosphokinase